MAPSVPRSVPTFGREMLTSAESFPASLNSEGIVHAKRLSGVIIFTSLSVDAITRDQLSSRVEIFEAAD
jgi:hypothetical protein